MDLQQRAAKSSISVLWDVEGPEPQLLLHSFPDVVQQLEDVAGRVNVKVIAPRFTSLSCYLVVSHCTTLTLAAAARLTAHGSSLCSCTTHTTDQETSCRVSFSGINWPSHTVQSFMNDWAGCCVSVAWSCRMKCLCCGTRWLIWSSCCWPTRTVLWPPSRRRTPT